MTTNKNQHIRCVYIVIWEMDTMTKAHFLIILIIVLSALLQYSVVYRVYGVQLKPNIGSASCLVHSVNLIQKNWLYLSFEFSCVRFVPLIFGFFLLVSSVCFFLLTFSVKHFQYYVFFFPFSFENGVHSRRYGL